jgi:hypothetical protein
VPAVQTPVAPDAALAPLRATLDSIRPLVTMSHDDLVVIALASDLARQTADYLTLADSPPAAGSAAVAQPNRSTTQPFEFSELDAGSVPTVQVKVGLQPLVVLAGETIVGGRQARVINVSVWPPPRKTTPIPVSCLEAGRWDAGRHFQPGRPVDVDFRAKVARTVGRGGRGHSHAFAADQGAVWHEIATREELAARRSPTAALHDLYESEAQQLAEAANAFPLPASACGLAVGIGGRLVALDLFDSPDTLARQWPRFIESAASGALAFRRRGGRRHRREANAPLPRRGRPRPTPRPGEARRQIPARPSLHAGAAPHVRVHPV